MALIVVVAMAVSSCGSVRVGVEIADVAQTMPASVGYMQTERTSDLLADQDVREHMEWYLSSHGRTLEEYLAEAREVGIDLIKVNRTTYFRAVEWSDLIHGTAVKFIQGGVNKGRLLTSVDKETFGGLTIEEYKGTEIYLPQYRDEDLQGWYPRNQTYSMFNFNLGLNHYRYGLHFPARGDALFGDSKLIKEWIDIQVGDIEPPTRRLPPGEVGEAFQGIGDSLIGIVDFDGQATRSVIFTASVEKPAGLFSLTWHKTYLGEDRSTELQTVAENTNDGFKGRDPDKRDIFDSAESVEVVAEGNTLTRTLTITSGQLLEWRKSPNKRHNNWLFSLLLYWKATDTLPQLLQDASTGDTF